MEKDSAISLQKTDKKEKKTKEKKEKKEKLPKEKPKKQNKEKDKVEKEEELMETVAKFDIEAWKYYYTPRRSKINDQTFGEISEHLKNFTKVSYWFAKYKLNSGLPSEDYMINNQINGLFQRIGTAIRKVAFARALVEITEEKCLTMVWLFDHEKGAEVFLEKKKKKKANSDDVEDYGDDDEDAENKSIYEMFEWNQLKPFENSSHMDLLKKHLSTHDSSKVINLTYK